MVTVRSPINAPAANPTTTAASRPADREPVDRRGGEPEERPGIHGALDAEVEDPGSLAVGLADGAVHERGGVAKGGAEEFGQKAHGSAPVGRGSFGAGRSD